MDVCDRLEGRDELDDELEGRDELDVWAAQISPITKFRNLWSISGYNESESGYCFYLTL